MSPKRFALGVDIGGTFTDLVVFDSSSGRVQTGKVLNDYGDLAETVLRGARQILANGSFASADLARVVHGTTLVTNALIERRGADTALIVTKGFRDVLEFGRESRYDIYAIDLEVPQPLVPRQLVFEADERLDRLGNVLQELDESGVRTLARDLVKANVRAVAVCLLHAYRKAVHERRIAAIFAEEAPGIDVSLSSDVMPDIREYERACTTVANAYVQPQIRDYLDNLAGGLRSLGVTAPLLLMTSDGGTISSQTALSHPVRLVESGPAGGAIAASFIGREHDIDRILAYDMGGTTAKICLIEGQAPEHTDRFEFGRVFRFAKGSGLPLSVPSIEMIEIGAGGGSIAHVDTTGRLRIGPQSSGASPGPACYGLGGQSATVTDADLFLGYLDADSFLGGRMKLDRDAAAAAIDRSVAQPLALSRVRAASGIYDVVNDNMARAAKIHCLERGKDAREYTLVAYGGAGPVHAEAIARELGIRTIVYPLRAGVMSAFGFLVAPPSFEMLHAIPAPLEMLEPVDVNPRLREMESRGRALVRSAGVAALECIVRREVDLRFRGQSFQLSVALPNAVFRKKDVATLRTRFLHLYRERFHRLNPDVPLEVTSVRVIVSGKRKAVKLQRISGTGSRAKKGERKIYFSSRGAFVTGGVYDRYALPPRARIAGPAVIEEAESTVVLHPGSRGRVAENGSLIVTLPS
jgi:N-methylhydantoinase A